MLFFASVQERLRELGVLHALGSTTGQLVGASAVSQGTLGTIGSLLGIPLGLGVYLLFKVTAAAAVRCSVSLKEWDRACSWSWRNPVTSAVVGVVAPVVLPWVKLAAASPTSTGSGAAARLSQS